MTATPPEDGAQPGDRAPTDGADRNDGTPDGGTDGATEHTDGSASPTGPVVPPAGGADEPPRSASLTPTERVFPTWTDPTVRRAADLIGGPLGRHAQVGRNRIITPLRVCIAMAIVILIGGWLFKAACIQTGPDGNLDQGGQRPWITACYTDVVPLYGSHELDIGALPYKASWLDNGEVRYMEYPVLTGFWMYLISGVSHGYVAVAKATGLLPDPLDVGAYFTVGAIALGLLYLWAVSCTAKIARRRIWDTAIMCLAPLLVVHAFTNWDLLAIGLTAGAMLAWVRRRPVLAGVLFGLGAAAKLYPVLLLGPLLILCLRAGKMREWTRTAVAAAAVWLVINLPVMLAWPSGWYEFIRLNSERPPEYDSWYFIYATLAGSSIWDKAPGADSPSLVNLLSLVLFAAACVLIGWFGLSVRRRPRFAQLAFLVVAAFLLTNKVWSPQYSLWLLPLAVLALPRWRPLLFWQASEAIVWVLLMLSFAGEANKGLSIYPFINAALVRDALVLMLVYLVVRDVLRPERDPVRIAGDDDPSGGVLEDAPDRFTVPSLPALWARRRGSGTEAAVAVSPAAESESAPQPLSEPERESAPDRS